MPGPGAGFTIIDRGDVPIAVVVDPGTKPGVLFVHATGLCKETWEPVISALSSATQRPLTIAMDQRCHGDSGRASHPVVWTSLGQDVLGVVGEHRGMVGVGHSSGAAALLIAEVEQPGTFSALVMIEPIVFPPPHRRLEDTPLIAATSKRRTTFSSRKEAAENFCDKGPFATWGEEALEAYIEGGLRADGEGTWVLKCDPADEAEFYRGAFEQTTWDELPEISCPVVLVAGAGSDTHTGQYLDALTARFADVQLLVIDGASHFVPMEVPEIVAAVIDAVRDGRRVPALG